jgi:serine/threonine-protein kinase HipA
LSIDEVVQDRMFAKFRKARPVLEGLIDRSFLDKERQERYKELVMKKYQQIRLDL